MEYFDDELGLSSDGYELLNKYDYRIYEGSDDFGKEETGILDVYMLAFKLAQEQLKED